MDSAALNSVHVRFIRARPSRLQEINDLIARSKSHWPWPAEYLQAALPLHALSLDYLEKNLCVQVLDERDGLVAFGSLAEELPVLLLDNLWVDPVLIGRGVGRQTFQYLLQAATDRGASAIRVLPDPPAEGFYRRMGFVDTGERIKSRVTGGPVYSAYRLSLQVRVFGQ